jgi:hypothetical protein
MPWVKAGTTRLRKGKTVEYVRNDLLFRFDLAEKILFEVNLAAVLDTASREEFLALVSNLVDWTIQEILPPWVNRRTDKPRYPPALRMDLCLLSLVRKIMRSTHNRRGKLARLGPDLPSGERYGAYDVAKHHAPFHDLCVHKA